MQLQAQMKNRVAFKKYVSLIEVEVGILEKHSMTIDKFY